MSEIISVHGVCKKYKSQDRYALKDIHFTVEEGEIIEVVSVSGNKLYVKKANDNADDKEVQQ